MLLITYFCFLFTILNLEQPSQSGPYSSNQGNFCTQYKSCDLQALVRILWRGTRIHLNRAELGKFELKSQLGSFFEHVAMCPSRATPHISQFSLWFPFQTSPTWIPSLNKNHPDPCFTKWPNPRLELAALQAPQLQQGLLVRHVQGKSPFGFWALDVNSPGCGCGFGSWMWEQLLGVP